MAETGLIGSVTITELLIFLFLFLATVFLGSTFYSLARRFLDDKIGLKNSKIFARLGQYTILVSGLFYGIYLVLGLDFTALLASLGILGIAIAFSSQQIIQNVIAGIMIVIDKPIQIEDWVEIGGIPITGINRVKDITLMKTVLRDRDNRIVYVPNSVIISSKLVNYSRAGVWEIPISITVSCKEDLETVRKLVEKTAAKNNLILPEVPHKERSLVTKIFRLPHIQNLFERKPRMNMFEPRVLISEIKDGKMFLSVRVWIREPQNKDLVTSDFLDELRKEFNKRKIKFD